MLDPYKRKISYLRISVTDRCNLRCRYCMPEEGIKLLEHKDILRFDEIVEVAKIAVENGINKIRITGGEPLVRKNIVSLVEKISNIKGVEDFGMTTNGILLSRYAQELKDAGLHRINISLDTLSPERYSYITRGGNINDVFEGIKASKKAGLHPIKINVVVFDKNDIETKKSLIDFCKSNELEIRFISKMDLDSGEFSVVEGGTGGNCEICNRLRLTADGLIKPCLFSDVEFNIRELGILESIKQAISHKPEKGTMCHNNKFFNIGG